MTLIEKLFYKTDESTNQMRISKTKTITCIVFALFFILAMTIYLTSPQSNNIFILIIAAILVGLVFAFPTFIVGWLIGKLLNRNKTKNIGSKRDLNPQPSQNINTAQTQNINEAYNHNPDNVTPNIDFNTQTAPNINPAPSYDSKKKEEILPDYAKEFKRAVEEDDTTLASDLLLKWDKNDANYKYASLIFEGIPPTDLSLTQMNEILKTADNMKAYDESLKDWYRSTAVEVINMNRE